MGPRVPVFSLATLVILILANVSAFGESPSRSEWGEVQERFEEALRALPATPTGAHAGLFSSFDRTGGNDDGNRLYAYSRYDRSTRIFTLFESGGIGEITRFWMTGWRNPETITWRRDGSSEGYDTVPVLDHFSGDRPGFASPLVADEYDSSGGFISYVPLSWEDRIAVETGSVPRYFQLGYRQYASQDAVRDWYTRRGMKRYAPSEVQTNESDSGDLFGDLVGWITEIRIEIADAEYLGNLWVRLTVDGRTSIDAPLSLVAGGSREGEVVDAVPVRVLPAESVVFRFPIPVTQDYILSVFPTEDDLLVDDIPQARRRIRVLTVPDPSLPREVAMGRIGTFHSEYRENTISASGLDSVLLDVTGRGVLAGAVLEVDGLAGDDLKILEGDERIFIDGSRSPQIHGTGTEDFFNGGWYYEHGTFTRPFTGHVHRGRQNGYDEITQYRYLLLDPIPFYRSLLFRQELGPANDVEGRARSLMIWYATDRGLMQEVPLTAETRSRASTETRELPIWGDPQASPVAVELTTISPGERIVLTADVPDGKGTLLLRRGTDASFVPQRGTVLHGDDPVVQWVVSGHSRTPMYREVSVPLPGGWEGSLVIEGEDEFVGGQWRLFVIPEISRMP